MPVPVLSGIHIQASRELSEKDIPFIGVNIGTLGYLKDTDMSSFEETLESLLRDDYEIDISVSVR